MIKFNTSALPERLAKGLDILSNYFDFETGGDIPITAQKGDCLKTDFNGERLHVVYNEEAAFYRAVGNVLQAGGAVLKTEKPHFDMCGAMYDHSRNGVLNLDYTKSFIADLALLGMNTYLMYMEDVYELEGEPQFGYQRGAYTCDELREIDDFAYALGIEVIPCIQTLAHLNQFLRDYDIAQKYGDIDDILEVGKPEVADLADRMFRTLKKAFRTTRFHVGMDEAHSIGRGKYLDHNGYRPRKEILRQHLGMLEQLAHKYGVELMIWDDMFYRSADSELSGARPDCIRVVYWNYYNEDEESYESNFDRRLADDPQMMFAGGAWRWGSAVPCHRKTEKTTECALNVCVKKGVRNVFTTLWGDDGSEAPAQAGMLGVTMFAEYNYQPQFSKAEFAEKLEFITGQSYGDWMLQDEINAFDPDADNTNTFSKYAVYQDPLCGLYDESTRIVGERFDLTKHYSGLAEKFECLAQKDGKMADINRFYAALCSVLELKWNLGNRLINAYKADDKAELANIVKTAVIPLIERIETMRVCRLRVWTEENKLEGFEVLDQRIGTLAARMRTTADVVGGYVDGKVKSIPSLATDRIMRQGTEPVSRSVFYSKIFSAGKVW
jgi:hexosaminidase